MSTPGTSRTLPSSALVLKRTVLSDHPGMRDCTCEDPTLMEQDNPRTRSRDFVSGYVISIPPNDVRPTKILPPPQLVREVRLCRRCAVELAIAILDVEVAP